MSELSSKAKKLFDEFNYSQTVYHAYSASGIDNEYIEMKRKTRDAKRKSFEEYVVGLESRIAELKGVIEILEDQQREVKNILIDKNLHIDSLYEEGYKLQQRIAELDAAQRWIPVGERLPRHRKSVLTINESGEVKIMTFVRFGVGYGWLFSDEQLYYCTHWMPLPQPPEVTG